MADGSRFPSANFHPHNIRIPAPFTNEISFSQANRPGLPQSPFFPQSHQSTSNSVHGHVSQKFPVNPGHNMAYHNVQRYSKPPLQQNHGNLRQGKQPMGVNIPEMQRQSFPAGQFTTDKQRHVQNSSPNSHYEPFSGHGQIQLRPNSSQTNMNNNIAHHPSSFSAGALQISNLNSLPAANKVSIPHENSSFSSFTESSSGPFPQPISGSHVPAPIQFPPSLPTSSPAMQLTALPSLPNSSPAIHLLAPPSLPNQTPSLHMAAPVLPVGQPTARVQEFSSQDKINTFLKERGISKQDKQQTIKSNLKLHTAKDLMVEWLQLISELSLQRDKLAELASSQNELEWKQELDKAQVLKARIEQIQALFSFPEEIKKLEEQVLKRKKKREWQKRRREEEYSQRQEAEERKKKHHKKIDAWRSQIMAKDEAKRRAESMKHEAGGVLGEVKRKQTEATKAVDLLRALRKLREARKQEAEVKGVYLKPTEEQNRRFDERVKWVENVMVRRRELYEAEEKTLQVMLAEEEEEKEKERREMERKKQESLGLSDPMDWFHTYYNQAESNLQSLLQIRRQWDAFLVLETFPGASRIPDGCVTPTEPSSELWATALIDKG